LRTAGATTRRICTCERHINGSVAAGATHVLAYLACEGAANDVHVGAPLEGSPHGVFLLLRRGDLMDNRHGTIDTIDRGAAFRTRLPLLSLLQGEVEGHIEKEGMHVLRTDQRSLVPTSRSHAAHPTARPAWKWSVVVTANAIVSVDICIATAAAAAAVLVYS